MRSTHREDVDERVNVFFVFENLAGLSLVKKDIKVVAGVFASVA